MSIIECTVANGCDRIGVFIVGDGFGNTDMTLIIPEVIVSFPVVRNSHLMVIKDIITDAIFDEVAVVGIININPETPVDDVKGYEIFISTTPVETICAVRVSTSLLGRYPCSALDVFQPVHWTDSHRLAETVPIICFGKAVGEYKPDITREGITLEGVCAVGVFCHGFALIRREAITYW